MADPHRLDGWSARALALELGLPAVELRPRVGSTMDVAHERAARGAPAGTLVVADEQTVGRGRNGRRWASAAGGGLWFTLVERPNDPAAVEVLSLRLGLAAAPVVDRYAAAPVRVKWPNDLYVKAKKLAGILVEARWRDDRLDWVALGMGINLSAPPEVEIAAGLDGAVSRIELLAELVPALRAATAARGPLSARDLASYRERDYAWGRTATHPAAGRVAGITESGALVIAGADGERSFRGGSLVLAEDAA
ncbi:MAG: hypothetical protein NVS9B3_06160 [Gemmatimonadaceae bacterium]